MHEWIVSDNIFESFTLGLTIAMAAWRYTDPIRFDQIKHFENFAD